METYISLDRKVSSSSMGYNPIASFALYQPSFTLATTSGICTSSLKVFLTLLAFPKCPQSSVIFQIGSSFYSCSETVLFSPSQHVFEHRRSASVVSFFYGSSNGHRQLPPRQLLSLLNLHIF